MNANVLAIASTTAQAGNARQMQGYLGTLTFFLDVILRPSFGSQYYKWPQVVACLSAWLFGIWGTAALSAALDYFYFKRDFRIALYEASVMSVLLWLALAYTVLRVYRRVVDMRLEHHSQAEEGPLWIIKKLPNGHLWTYQRLLWEPLLVSWTATVLAIVGLLPKLFPLFIYLCAFALFMRAACTYWEGWQHCRGILDEAAQLPVIQAIAEGAHPPQTLGRMVFASIPASTPPSHRKAIALKMAGLTPEMESLLTKAA